MHQMQQGREPERLHLMHFGETTFTSYDECVLSGRRPVVKEGVRRGKERFFFLANCAFFVTSSVLWVVAYCSICDILTVMGNEVSIAHVVLAPQDVVG